MRAARAALPPGERAAASRRICHLLEGLTELVSARLVAGYASAGSEVDIDAWLRSRLARGAGVCLPVVHGADLALVPVADLAADLVPGWRGMREPRLVPRPAVPPALVDAVVVPAVAFDADGNRLGQGGGHYDRLLARLPPAAVVVGVGFTVQVVDALPVQAHDRRADIVVTEHGVRRTGRFP